MAMDLELERRWPLFEGCNNFRDLGGYRAGDGRRVRWGQVYRSDALSSLSNGDIDHLREERGLRTVIDLRHARELAASGTARCVAPPRVTLRHCSLNRTEITADDPVPDLDQLGIVYLWMIRGIGPMLAEVLRGIAEVPLPLVFHCAAGKDRTGIVAATLLDLLGVPEETIIADYALTELAGLELSEADRAAAIHALRIEGTVPEGALNARPEHMAAFLRGVDQSYGGLRPYLAYYGVDDPLVERLRERLLE